MRSSPSRYRATAITGTVLLHLALAVWLLSLRYDLPRPVREAEDLVWLTLPRLLPQPPPGAPPVIPAEPIRPPTDTLPGPETVPPQVLEHDWYGDARAVVRELSRGSEQRTFGSAPSESERPEPKPPPSVFKQPLPRVGTTVTTPEGETILWVSDYCYISLGSTSLTMQDLHQARRGVRQCIIPVGRREPRGDLFEHLERPPKTQQ